MDKNGNENYLMPRQDANEQSTHLVPTTVAEVMTRDVKTLAPDQSVAELVRLLAAKKFHHVIVAKQGYLLGVISDHDVFRQLSRVDDWPTKTVAEIMHTNTFTIRSERLLSSAAEEMVTRRVNCLPVLDGSGKIIGLLTSTDIMRLYMDIQKRFESEIN